MVKKHGLEISQPGIEVGPSENLVQWNITKRRVNSEVHKYGIWNSGYYSPLLSWFNFLIKVLFSILLNSLRASVSDSKVILIVFREERDPQCIDPHLPPCAAYATLSLSPSLSQYIYTQYTPIYGVPKYCTHTAGTRPGYSMGRGLTYKKMKYQIQYSAIQYIVHFEVSSIIGTSGSFTHYALLM